MTPDACFVAVKIWVSAFDSGWQRTEPQTSIEKVPLQVSMYAHRAHAHPPLAAARNARNDVGGQGRVGQQVAGPQAIVLTTRHC